MEQEEFVDSPCISVCKIAASGFCIGCRRSIDEIANWPYMSNPEKKQVLGEIVERKKPPKLTPIPGSN